MRSTRTGPGTLLLVALIAVLSLMAVSDFQPSRAARFADLDEARSGEIAVIVIRCRPCTGGHILNLTDGQGGWADAFCSLELCKVAPQNGTSALMVVRRSPDDPSFLYVQRITVTAVPLGKV